MEIKKTGNMTSKPQSLILSDGTVLTPNERTNIKNLHRKHNWKPASLCSHFDISDADMKKILGTTTK